MFRHFLIASLLLGPLFVGRAEASRPPNIVLILIDDLGWADLACYGSDFYRTPHLDQLAREGVRFTDAYAAAPVCSPTRAAILTGRFPARLHLTDWLPGRPDRPDQKLARPPIRQALPIEEETLAELLREAGYATAHVGKWHLGGTGFSPEKQGFDLNVAGDHTGTPLSYFHPFRNQERWMPGLEKSQPGEYLTDRLTDEAERFIRDHQDRPFFLHLSHYAVHTPMRARPELIEKYELAAAGGRQTNAIYAAMIESMDESVGRILKTLDDLRLSEQTIVIFTSDNGGLSTREGPNTPATSNAPLRAGKGHLYEGGIRVPLLIRAPGIHPRVCPDPAVSMDLLPTLLELAGIPADLTGPRDGRSLGPALRGERLEPRPLFWHYPHYANQGGKPGGVVREGRYKLIEFFESGYLELFDLSSDLSEARNLAGQFPERANALRKKLADWRESVGAQSMQPHAGYVSVPIRPRADGTVLLHGKDATIHGEPLLYESPAHKNTIGFWTRPENWVSWDFAIETPGSFSVEIMQGCGTGHGGSEVEFSVAGHVWPVRIVETGHFQSFVVRELGVVRLEQPGRHTFTVQPRSRPGGAVMDLRQVLLRPVAVGAD